MNLSLMLKNNDGAIEGYVLLQEDRLFLRMKGNGETGKLILLKEEGGQEETEIPCDAAERERMYSGGELTGAYVMIHEKLMAFSGEEAKKAFNRRRDTVAQSNSNLSTEKKPAQECKNSASQCVYNEEQKSYLKAGSGVVVCGRWPPPPCWPSARYVEGMWREGE